MIVGRVLHAFHSFCLQVRGWVVPALNGDRKWLWQYLKPQDPVGLFHLATWTWLNSLCKMKSWSREIYLLKSSSSYSGRCESETGVLVSCLPSPRSPAPGTEAAGLLRVLFGQTWLLGKELRLPGHYISSQPQRKEDFLQPIFSKGLEAKKFCH